MRPTTTSLWRSYHGLPRGGRASHHCIVAHERQAWHVGGSGLCLASSLREPKSQPVWVAGGEPSCETALRSDRVGAAYEDGLACTPSPASRVSTTSLRGCWLWGCTGWRAARCLCCSWPAQGASTPPRQRSRPSRLFRPGRGRSPHDWLVRVSQSLPHSPETRP